MKLANTPKVCSSDRSPIRQLFLRRFQGKINVLDKFGNAINLFSNSTSTHVHNMSIQRLSKRNIIRKQFACPLQPRYHNKWNLELFNKQNAIVKGESQYIITYQRRKAEYSMHSKRFFANSKFNDKRSCNTKNTIRRTKPFPYSFNTDIDKGTKRNTPTNYIFRNIARDIIKPQTLT